MQVNKTYKVGIIDFDLVHRTGLCTLINDLQDYNAIHVNELLDNCSIRIENLDAIVFSLTELDIKFIHRFIQLKSDHKTVPIIVIAKSLTKEEQFKLFNLGAESSMVGQINQLSLKQSLQCAVAGGTYYPDWLLNKLRVDSQRPLNSQLVKVAFSDNQKKILQLLALGYSTPQVAEKLFRSTRTIEWHKQQMMKLACVSSTSQLLLFAVEYSVIESPFAEENEGLIISDKKGNEQIFLP